MSTTLIPPTDKQYVLETVNQFSDSATLHEISDRIALMAALRRGDEDIEAGRVISHEEICRRSLEWCTR